MEKTIKQKMSVKVIERRDVIGSYDMRCTQAIVDHSEFGRLLITEGFCGMYDLRGGQYLWEGGVVAQLRPDDTFETLQSPANSIGMTILSFVLDGRDQVRPMLPWPGPNIARLAKKCGL